ncbi:hypothetical protein [Frigoriflavimonas asaccharolytica]|uniref:Tetratricopeptide (TPR) repeat protein n=1 Tax=Frigoriflavimonas asaccharolytica TaxID=2735899 RepID=A0A8J8GA89_9FLAO|nr:hypothetical protein [Frigoriflavimonas asaccharolytica]NRS92847.1 tetratricopeptide (TPR) repeat protein [Frigoriflavimonas asaccharolytica]
MKIKILISAFVLLAANILSAQKQILPQDINFDTPIFETEKEWVLLPPKDENSTELYAVMLYFDDVAGYTLQLGDSFELKNGVLLHKKADETGATKIRWQNLRLKVAKLSDERLIKFNIDKSPEWLKNYYTEIPTVEDLVDRLSILNGQGMSDIALPKLLVLHAKNYKSAKFYFELAFANNALGKFSEAEKIIEEADKLGFNDELMIKEKIYSLSSQKKLPETSAYLEKNLNSFKTKLYLEESIANLLNNYYIAQDFVNVQKWIDIYKKNITKGKYTTTIEQLEAELKTKK